MILAATSAGLLPAVLLPPDHQPSPLASLPRAGDLVVVRSRGRYRIAKVERVGPKRAGVAYTTPDSVAEAQRAEAGRTCTFERACEGERLLALEQAAHYQQVADEIERLKVAPTQGHVPAVQVPEPLRSLLLARGRNAAGTVVVWPVDVWRGWARDIRAGGPAHEAALQRARARDALSPADRVAQDTHVTRLELKLAEVFALPPCDEAAPQG